MASTTQLRSRSLLGSGVLVAGTLLGLLGGCVVYVDEDARDACSELTCGANAYCDFGVCRCFEGYAGDPEDSCNAVQTWLVTDSCDDDTEVEFRLFSQSRDWVWPSDGVYLTLGYDVDVELDVQCSEGETICFGGRANDIEWGVGIDGVSGCDACCYECEANTYVDMGLLTCP